MLYKNLSYMSNNGSLLQWPTMEILVVYTVNYFLIQLQTDKANLSCFVKTRLP